MCWAWAAVGLLIGTCLGCGLMAVIAGGATEDAWKEGEREGFRRATGFDNLGDR